MIITMNLDRQALQVPLVVAFYMTAALVMVFVNKAVLSATPDLPLLFLFIQLLIAVVLLHLSALVTSRVEIPRLALDTAVKLAPVILVNIIGLVFNILCLRDVEPSFFQIARGLNLPFTIVASALYAHARPSGGVLIAAFIVTIGFLVGVAPSSSVPRSSSPPSVSLLYGCLSSVFIALHAVIIKASLSHCGNSTIQLAYWTNLGSALLLAPVMALTGEVGSAWAALGDPSWNWNIFAWGSVVTGVFGFLLCVAGLLSIKVTSPITHMFSSAARSVIQTLLGVWIFHDVVTVNRGASILVILAGTMYYTWVKSHESKPTAQYAPPVDLAPLDKERQERLEEGKNHLALPVGDEADKTLSGDRRD